MSYSYITFAQAKTLLARRLNDAGKVYWTDSELGRYITESLRFWNASANYHRDRGSFVTVAGQPFYDLTQTAPISNLVGNNFTEQDIINYLQFHLLEPVNDWSVSKVWAGSEMFTMDDLTQALQRRRNQFLEETGIYLGVPATINVVAPGSGVIPVGNEVIHIRRLAWKDADGVYTELYRTDSATANAQIPGWSYNAAPPQAYSITTAPVTNLQLIPIPLDSGELLLVSVDAGPDLDPAVGIKLEIDDDFAQFVKWGALADLLSREGQSFDPQRAEYCEKRYREGVELGKITSTAFYAEVNGVPVPLCSLYDLDKQVAGWENVQGLPQTLAIENSTLLACYPVPDNVYSIVLDVVRNAVVPTVDGDYLQIGKEYLDVILGYAQHLACFKLGGQEFQSTMGLYEQLMREAANYNAKLAASANNFAILSDRSAREEQQRPKQAA